MSDAAPTLTKSILVRAINWFRSDFGQTLVAPLDSNFPNWPLPNEIQAILRHTDHILNSVEECQTSEISLNQLISKLGPNAKYPSLFKCIILRYRRIRAAATERLTEKTFHLELTSILEEEVNALDAWVNQESFQAIAAHPVPRLKDFLPVQLIEAGTEGHVSMQPRQHDEKFHILQAPSLFWPDIAYFRAKCEDRETSLAVAFLDIDDFKAINAAQGETKVDRNLLPRFMQTIEAHVYHHGFAYRQGGDEYLILVPSFSRSLAIGFLHELGAKLASLSYPEIEQRTTVSIGMCLVDPDCPLTDRELLDRANRAKEFAKAKGKNRIATYSGVRMDDGELQIVP